MAAAFGVIVPIFFGGSGLYANYTEAKRGVEERRSGYRSAGYSGPVPYRLTNARTGQFIEEGT